MELKLTNTMSGRLELFSPQDNKKVTMYVCGPTVYDNPHIGNGRAIVLYDMLYRILSGIYENSTITYVRNITDVDDKIINRAKELGCTINDLTSKVTEVFHSNCAYLNCIKPTFEPRATDHINDMIDIISRLINNDNAYEIEGSVYFSARSYKDYGILAGRNIDELRAGARVDIDNKKRDPEDFILWKPSEDIDFRFKSPWGEGRPGWHIECSAMSYKFLGQDFDIHGGGADLMFPHHTNEIAQSCCAFEGSGYAKFWVHNGFLTVNGEKMSKSLGNFITIEDIKNKNPRGEILRMLLLSTHYRSPLDYSEKSYSDMKSNLDYLYRAIDGADRSKIIDFKSLPNKFISHILDDMNIHSALTYMIEIAREIHKEKTSEKIQILYSCGKFLGIFESSLDEWFKGHRDSNEIENLISQRSIAKQNKNWAESDRIRHILNEMGIIIEDKPDGSVIWREK
jgi:cysteinyl-tRNA synthetase